MQTQTQTERESLAQYRDATNEELDACAETDCPKSDPEIHWHGDVCIVECSGCGNYGPVDTEPRAVAGWNLQNFLMQRRAA
jgi:hypothetical protein